MEKHTIYGRSFGFYFCLAVILFLIGIIVASFIAFLQTKNIIFPLNIGVALWISYGIAKAILSMRISYTSDNIQFKPGKKKINISDIISIEIASAKYFDNQARLNNNSYILKKLSEAKTTRSYSPGSPVFFPMWLALKYQPYLYIIYKGDKKFLFNLDPYTKRSIRKFILFLKGKGVKVEIRENILSL